MLALGKISLKQAFVCIWRDIEFRWRGFTILILVRIQPAEAQAHI